MALTKVSGNILDPGINVAGVVTATRFDGPFSDLTTTELDVTGIATFKNDVEFVGTTAGFTSVTWDKSANSLHFKDNSKAVFGTDSDLELYHGGTASYISHAGAGNLYIHSDTVAIRKQNQDTYFLGQNGAATLYNGGNEKLKTTGYGVTITGGVTVGAALTVQGDLYVEGTRTEVKSATLEITDKTIGISSTGSPSDTTADGAGIVVYGATDKSLKWENSSDSWLTSEHFKVPDDKKVQIGSSEDLQLYHSSDVSWIDNTYAGSLTIKSAGEIRFRTNSFTVKDQGNGDTIIHAADGSGVDLYASGGRRLHTTDYGVTVTGEIVTNQDYPTQRPTLDFNFIRTKTLDSIFTYQRLGAASFVNEQGLVELVGDNTPRFDHDPVTRECKGLLIEESKINFIYPSSDWSGDYWTINNSGSLSRETHNGDTKDPAGTYTATKLVTLASNTNTKDIWWTKTNITYTNGSKYAVSCFAKSTTGLHLQLRPRGQGSNKAWATYNLSTGVVGNSGGTTLVSTKIEKYPNGWYRCSLVFTGSGCSGSCSLGTIIMDDGNDTETVSHTGDASKSIYLWGAQHEVGSFVTSYITTNGTTATRGADIVLLDDIENEMGYNQLEGTAIADFSYTQDMDGGQTIFNFSGTESAPDSSSPRTWLRVNQSAGTDNTLRIYRNSDYNDSSATATAGVFQKVAYAYESGDADVSLNGTSIIDTSRTPDTNIFRLSLGNIGWSLGNETTSLEGHIRRFMYYPKKLPNSQLNNLTS